MSAELAVNTLLLASPVVAAFVGDRIYPDEAPQDIEQPHIIYSGAGVERDRTTSGHTGRVTRRIQIDFFGRSYLEAFEMFEAARLVLDDYIGLVADVNVRGIVVQNDHSVPRALTTQKFHHRIADFMVTFDE